DLELGGLGSPIRGSADELSRRVLEPQRDLAILSDDGRGDVKTLTCLEHHREEGPVGRAATTWVEDDVAQTEQRPFGQLGLELVAELESTLRHSDGRETQKSSRQRQDQNRASRHADSSTFVERETGS